MLSFPYLINRKFIPYLLLNILGFVFHSSALLYIPLYFFLTIHLPGLIIWCGIIIANIIFIFNIGFINDFLNNLTFFKQMSFYDNLAYYTSTAKVSKFSIGFFERSFAILLFTYFRKVLVKRHKYYDVFYNCYWFYYISYLSFFEIQVFVDRFPMLFTFSYWILYPAVTSIYTKWRVLLNILIGILVVLKIYASTNNVTASYQNILWDDVNYKRTSQIQLEIINNNE